MGGFSGGPPGTVTPGGPPGTGRRPVASAQKERVFDPDFATVAPRVDLEAPDIPIFDPRGGWAAVVDWWFSHDIPTEGLPSGGGLMIGPQEAAKGLNFLKDALLPLMAGDIGLAGVAGLGPFDPLPIPGGKIVAKGADVAKGAGRAIRGAVGGADEAVEAAARVVRPEGGWAKWLLEQPGGRVEELNVGGLSVRMSISQPHPTHTRYIGPEGHISRELSDVGDVTISWKAFNQLESGLTAGEIRGGMREIGELVQSLADEGFNIWASAATPGLGRIYRNFGFKPEKAGNLTGRHVLLGKPQPAAGVARETGEAVARTVVGETAPTLDAFTEMAGRGKLHGAKGSTRIEWRTAEVRASPIEAQADTPFEMGVINGYSEDDIAHFYLALRAPWNKARTAKNVGAVRDDMRELAYEQFLEDRAEYLAKQPAGGVARETGEAVARADAGPWTQKLLDADAQRQAGIDAGKSFDEMSYGEQLVDLDRFAEKIDVSDPSLGPLGEITINYNHPWYSAHGERVVEISWNPKETLDAGLFEKTPLQQAPMGQRAAWARPVLRKVKQITDEMTAEGITVVADVAADRRSLIRLYENAGFVQVPRGAAPVSTAAQQTPADLHLLAREGMVEMVRRPGG